MLSQILCGSTELLPCASSCLLLCAAHDSCFDFPNHNLHLLSSVSSCFLLRFRLCVMACGLWAVRWYTKRHFVHLLSEPQRCVPCRVEWDPYFTRVVLFSSCLLWQDKCSSDHFIFCWDQLSLVTFGTLLLFSSTFWLLVGQMNERLVTHDGQYMGE